MHSEAFEQWNIAFVKKKKTAHLIVIYWENIVLHKKASLQRIY